MSELRKLFLYRLVGGNDVSVKITHCGVCYADVAYTRNKRKNTVYPVVPGYVSSSPFHLLVCSSLKFSKTLAMETTLRVSLIFSKLSLYIYE